MEYQVKFFPPQAVSSSLAAAPSSTDLDKMRADLEEARRVIQAEHDLARRQMEEEKKELRRQLDDYRLVAASQKAGFALYMEQMEQEKERERKEKEEAELREAYRIRQDAVKEQWKMMTTPGPNGDKMYYTYPHSGSNTYDTFIKTHEPLYILNAAYQSSPHHQFDRGGIEGKAKMYKIRDGEIKGFITATHVYLVGHSYDPSCVYTFDAPLTQKQLSLIDQLFVNKHGPLNNQGPIIHRMFYDEGGWVTDSTKKDANKKFESVIRLVKGSYQNGTWRQLDGFFGMYYNEDTNELLEYPPL